MEASTLCHMPVNLNLLTVKEQNTVSLAQTNIRSIFSCPITIAFKGATFQ